MGTAVPWVYETAQIGDDVLLKPDGQAGPDAENDDPIVVVATDPEGEDITYSIQQASEQAFAIDASTGELTVSGALDHETKVEHPLTIVAADPGGNTATLEITVHVLGSNESPEFTSPTGDAAVVSIDENRVSTDDAILTFTATDADGDDLTFTLRQGQSQDLFVIMNERSEMVEGVEVWSGDLHAKGTSAAEGTDAGLNFEYAGYDPRVHVEVNDPEGLNDTLLVTVNLNNLNDNMPIFDADPAATSLQVAENTARDYVLANYSATDDDGDTVFYDLGGDDEKSFSISDTGDLMTLESLDADNAMTPCGSDGCAVTVIAMDREDGLGMQNSVDVRITVTGVEDSVSTLDVSKANPVPWTTMGIAR